MHHVWLLSATIQHDPFVSKINETLFHQACGLSAITFWQFNELYIPTVQRIPDSVVPMSKIFQKPEFKPTSAHF
jgi:hypothetical protein